MRRIVFAASTLAFAWNGGIVHLRQGDAWDSTDRFVQANPTLFTDDLRFLHRTEPMVEQATAAPGEKRSVNRG